MANAHNGDDKKETLLKAAQKAFQDPFGAVLELNADDCAPIIIDGRKTPPKVSADKKAKPDCIWRAANDIMLRALSSERALENAYISGGLTISGDMSVMARLNLTAARA